MVLGTRTSTNQGARTSRWAIPTIIGVYFVLLGVLTFDFPYWDDFGLLDYVTRLRTGELSWRAFLAIRHVDHYVIVPKIAAALMTLPSSAVFPRARIAARQVHITAEAGSVQYQMLM